MIHILMIVDRVKERSRKDGTSVFVGSVISRKYPDVVKTLRVIEPLEVGKKLKEIVEDAFVLLTYSDDTGNKILTNTNTEVSQLSSCKMCTFLTL